MKALIMAGGQGTRFWPLSRELYPKQLLKLNGDHTLLQQTVLRLGPLVKAGDVHVITGRKLLVDIRTQLSELDAVLPKNIIVEPEPRNTAPAVGLGALLLEKSAPGCVMAVLPSDHMINDKGAFHKALRKADALAKEGYLVVFGVRPTRPETGYGYIRLGKKIDAGSFRAAAFVEKPDMATAKGYVDSGDYLWNSGMFVWKAESILGEMKVHMPGLHKALMRVGKALGTKEGDERLAREFAKMKAVSVDYGIMEKSKRVAVVPVEFPWSDLGSWGSIEEIIKPDKAGNVTVGRVVSLECSDTTFYAEDRLVAAIGLKDMVVVDTPDATLVCRKEEAQKVKDVVAMLKEKGYGEYSTHRTVQRPWGSYTILLSGPMYKIKRIEVKPGAKLSSQMHHHRSEHWVVVAGTAKVSAGEKAFLVHVNESTYIPMLTKHRLENPGRVPLQIIEVQNGEYLEEDDIVRFDDDYERV